MLWWILEKWMWVEEMAARRLSGSLIQFYTYKRFTFHRSSAVIVVYHSLWYLFAFEQFFYINIVVG